MRSVIKFASLKHRDQRRKGGEPYIKHPLAVMKRVASLNLPKVAQKAAVLHDVCEDCGETRASLERQFGKRVSKLVIYLSKDHKQAFPRTSYGKDQRLKKYLHRIETGSQHDYLVLFIKMADQLDNLQTINVFTPDKTLRILREIKTYYLPLYMRGEELIPRRYLGAYKALYQDLCYQILVLTWGDYRQKPVRRCQGAISRFMDGFVNIPRIA